MSDLIPIEINIKTKRLQIKNITKEDIEDIAILYQDSITRKYLGGPLNKQDSILKANQMLNNNDKVYSIREIESNEFIGLLYLSNYYDNQNIELSYELLSNKFKKGYGYESLSKMLDYLKNYKINSVVAETQNKNINSIKLLEKLGYKKEKELIRFDEKQSLFSKKII